MDHLQETGETRERETRDERETRHDKSPQTKRLRLRLGWGRGEVEVGFRLRLGWGSEIVKPRPAQT